MIWLSATLDALATRRPAALVTVVGVAGSAPREVGAKMLVTAEDSVGSIGGGQLELLAIESARRDLSDGGSRRARLQKFSLGPDLGQCCGGMAQLMIESLQEKDRSWLEEWRSRDRRGQNGTLITTESSKTWGEATTQERATVEETAGGWTVIEQIAADIVALWIFGAGHVGTALVKVMAELPFRVTWLDSRPHAHTLPATPLVMPIVSPQVSLEVDAAPAGCSFLVMTHSHQLDLEICDRVMRRGDFAYLGLIGSATKKARFLNRLRSRGYSESLLGKLVCPIGMPGIPGKEPMAIAVATAAELLQLRQSWIRARAEEGEAVQDSQLRSKSR